MNRHTRLTRNTPMPRGVQRGWNSTLRPMSAKKRQEKADTDGPRRRLVAEVGCCMLCGQCDGVLDVHEVANGPDRCKAVYEPRLQLVLCREPCHRLMEDKAEWPPARQLAIRLMYELRQTVWTYQDVRGNKTVTIEETLKWLKD